MTTVPAQGREVIRVEAGKDGTMTLLPFALTNGLAQPLGKELTLYWIESYGGGVFLPFGDATNGQESFAGGRYLLDTIKSADLGSDGAGRLILDFNFAYYPSCAYSEAWVCPSLAARESPDGRDPWRRTKRRRLTPADGDLSLPGACDSITRLCPARSLHHAPCLLALTSRALRRNQPCAFSERFSGLRPSSRPA